MAERIELPQTPSGSTDEQLRQMYSYLYRMAQAMNHNLSEIGSMDLTDDEREIMQQIIAEDEGQQTASYDWQGKESLKSLIIKTAAFVQSSLNSYRLSLLGQYVADGKFGRYVRNTGLKVDVTPEGIQQDFTFEEVVQGLKAYTINAKNYIKTGLLRTVSSIPVYGVAIGKDVVTFAEDGTETYNDGNKVAELTADELSFYQGGNKVASYKGTELVFYQGGVARLKVDSNGVTVLNGTTKLAELLSSALKFYYAGTLRTQMDTDGVKIYDGSTLLATLNGSGITFTNGATKLAELLTSALKFYYNGTLRTQMDNDGVKLVNGNTTLAEFLTSALKFYYNGTLRTQMDSDGVGIYNGSTLLAKLTGNKISFYSNGTEVFCIENTGEINTTGSLKVKSGGTFEVDSTNFKIDSTNKKIEVYDGTLDNKGLHWDYGTHVFFLSTMDWSQMQIEKAYTGIRYLNHTNGNKTILLESRLGANYAPFWFPVGFRWTGDDAGAIHIGSENNEPSDVQDIVYYHGKYVLPAVQDYDYEDNPVTSGTYVGNSTLPWHYGYFTNLNYKYLTQISTKEIKHDIRPLESAGGKIDKLNPVTFVYDDDPLERTRCGLIYEETIDIMPEICTNREDEKAINYVEMIPMLLKEIQDLRARVKALEEREE